MAMARSLSRSFARLIALGTLLSASAEEVRAETCPQNCTTGAGCATAGTASYSIPASHGSGASNGSYDLRAGVVRTSGYWNSGNVSTADWFEVVQSPAPAPFQITIQMRAEMGTYYGHAAGSVSVDGKGELQESCDTPSDASNNYCELTRSLSFLVTPGETFYVRASSSGWNTGFMGEWYSTITYSLLNVPPGVVIRSCQGFVVDTVVPTRAATWGRVKRYYR